jgi:hypothetical protein
VADAEFRVPLEESLELRVANSVNRLRAEELEKQTSLLRERLAELKVRLHSENIDVESLKEDTERLFNDLNTFIMNSGTTCQGLAEVDRKLGLG